MNHLIGIAVVICGCATAATAALASEVDSAADSANTSTEQVGMTQAAAESAYHRQLICKREKVTGTNLRKQVCRTRAAADLERIESKAFLEKVQRDSARATQ
jgi:hypothetical protein